MTCAGDIDTLAAIVLGAPVPTIPSHLGPNSAVGIRCPLHFSCSLYPRRARRSKTSATSGHEIDASNRSEPAAPRKPIGSSAMPVSTVQEGVTRMLAEGSPLSDIEAFIERQQINDEQQAALWLWAWARQSLTRAA